MITDPPMPVVHCPACSPGIEAPALFGSAELGQLGVEHGEGFSRGFRGCRMGRDGVLTPPAPDRAAYDEGPEPNEAGTTMPGNIEIQFNSSAPVKDDDITIVWP
jgi:hypothetical protein